MWATVHNNFDARLCLRSVGQRSAVRDEPSAILRTDFG